MEAGKTRSNIPSQFFTPDEQDQLVKCIEKVETSTMAEIRIRVEKKCESDPLQRCRELLDQLGITNTRERTGMLIYLSVEDHKVAIFGDTAIHQVVGDEGWQIACKQLQERFKRGDFADAICETIIAFGKTLSIHFPSQPSNPNELPDEPSFEE